MGGFVVHSRNLAKGSMSRRHLSFISLNVWDVCGTTFSSGGIHGLARSDVSFRCARLLQRLLPWCPEAATQQSDQRSDQQSDL